MVYLRRIFASFSKDDFRWLVLRRTSDGFPEQDLWWFPWGGFLMASLHKTSSGFTELRGGLIADSLRGIYGKFTEGDLCRIHWGGLMVDSLSYEVDLRRIHWGELVADSLRGTYSGFTEGDLWRFTEGNLWRIHSGDFWWFHWDVLLIFLRSIYAGLGNCSFALFKKINKERFALSLFSKRAICSFALY